MIHSCVVTCCSFPLKVFFTFCLFSPHIASLTVILVLYFIFFMNKSPSCHYPSGILLMEKFPTIFFSHLLSVHYGSVCTIKTYFLRLDNILCIYDSDHRGGFFICSSDEKSIFVSLFPFLKNVFCQKVLLITLICSGVLVQ